MAHEPGQRLECDVGHIYVDFPEGRRRVPVLLPTWAYSYCPFAIALPTERTEAILVGMVEAFEFFACVPREVWWDNPRTVATAGHFWVRWPMGELLNAHAKSLAEEPPITAGTPDPYVPNR